MKKQKQIEKMSKIVKETAEKILFKFESAFAYYDNENTFSKKAIFDCLEEIVKSLGVEINESLIKQYKAQAVKEFAEKVKMAFFYEFDEIIPSIMSDKIDELIKEY